MMEDDIIAQYKSGGTGDNKGNETAKPEEVPASTGKPSAAANATENSTMQVCVSLAYLSVIPWLRELFS